MNYLLQLVQHPKSLRWQGMLFIDNKKIDETTTMISETLCIQRLNRLIERQNNMSQGKKIPLWEKANERNKIKIVPSQSTLLAMPTNNIDEQNTEKTMKKSTALSKEMPLTPKRKPFTPYGLSGYLVDKQGNVRLMLDRRASGKTVTISPEFFAQLADMVKLTQQRA